MSDYQKEIEKIERLRQAALNAISEDDVRQMMLNLMKRAKDGDREAVRLVLAYLTPQPQPAPRTQVNVLNARGGRNGKEQRRLIEHHQEESDEE